MDTSDEFDPVFRSGGYANRGGRFQLSTSIIAYQQVRKTIHQTADSMVPEINSAPAV